MRRNNRMIDVNIYVQSVIVRCLMVFYRHVSGYDKPQRRHFNTANREYPSAAVKKRIISCKIVSKNLIAKLPTKCRYPIGDMSCVGTHTFQCFCHSCRASIVCVQSHSLCLIIMVPIQDFINEELPLLVNISRVDNDTRFFDKVANLSNTSFVIELF